MGFFENIFGRKYLAIEHTLFGHLEHSKDGGWQRKEFSFWGSGNVQLLIEAGEGGPTAAQEAAFKHLVVAEKDLLPKCVALVESRRKKIGAPPGLFHVSTLSIPSLKDGKAGNLWTVWFDLEGDEYYSYGVQTEDEWKTLNAFADY